ncbi:probable amidase At4g34880 [Lolium perenne]|uniref:probable amidase At4g34880 n=1 Tax=Lolium perenne TaxID=4522 RepID=UPI003A9A29FF
MACLRLQLQALAAVLALVAANGVSHGFEFHEATVEAIHLGFSNGSLTSTALVQFYLNQISRLNPLLRAIIEVNPDALRQAARADARRASSGGRLTGGLHGIPVLLKDNIATLDALNTTAGSFALLGSIVKRDAGVVVRLRQAGAVVLGKANPSEWSNFRTVDSGWSARGGQSLNPYVLSSTPCGSSAGPGVAAAANMAAVTLGTETDGSILCPSSWNSVVGIKPTVGLTSRSGVIPITPRQDTVGPMCRTVSDAVQVLDTIVGYDAFDAAATGAASKYIPAGGYVQFLKQDGLRGKRIGVPNGFFQGYGEAELRVYQQHLDAMRNHGAVVIENLDVAANLTALAVDIASNEFMAVRAEFKLSLNAYLADLRYSPVRSLADVIAFNNANPVQERLKDFGQRNLIAAENTHGIGSVERAAIRRLEELSANGLERLIKEQQLDAIVTPNSSASSLRAIGGHPGIVVPAGYDEQGVPFGICFSGLQGYEPRLIEIAYAFEQATNVRRPPMFKP